jgi:hypothetical protein
MTIAFRCTACAAPLKVGDHFAGKRCKCPRCPAVIVVPAESQEDSGNRVANSPAAPAHRPAARPPVTDDDARAPRKRSIAKKKNGKTLVLVAAIIVLLGLGGLVMAGAVGGVIWWAVSKKSDPAKNETASADKQGDNKQGGTPGNKPKDASLREEIAYFPANTNVVASFQAADFLKTPFAQTMRGEIGNFIWDMAESQVEKSIGITANSVDRVVVAGNMNAAQPVIVVRTNKDVKSADLVAAMKQKEPNAQYVESKVKNGKYTIVEQRLVLNQFGGGGWPNGGPPGPPMGPGGGPGGFPGPPGGPPGGPPAGGPGGPPVGQATTPGVTFCVVDPRMILYGATNDLRAVLERDKAPDLTPGLQKAMKSVDFGATCGFAFDGKQNVANAGFGGLIGPGQFGNDNPVPECGYGTVRVDKDILMNLHVTFKDAKTAENAKWLADKGMADLKNTPNFKEFADLFDIKVKSSGSDVVMDMTVKGASLSAAIRKAANMNQNQR